MTVAESIAHNLARAQSAIKALQRGKPSRWCKGFEIVPGSLGEENITTQGIDRPLAADRPHKSLITGAI